MAAALQPPSIQSMEEKAICVVEDMLIDRGYTIHEIHRSRDAAVVEEENEMYTVKASRNGEWMFVFINEEEKVNIAGIKDRLSTLKRECSDSDTKCRCIIIYRSSVTATAKKSIETLEYKFELFGLNELQLNITQHRLVPRHVPVSQEEKVMLDADFKGKLPQILVTDPVCRYFAFERGQYIRIHRKDGSMTFRVVK